MKTNMQALTKEQVLDFLANLPNLRLDTTEEVGTYVKVPLTDMYVWNNTKHESLGFGNYYRFEKYQDLFGLNAEKVA